MENIPITKTAYLQQNRYAEIKKSQTKKLVDTPEQLDVVVGKF